MRVSMPPDVVVVLILIMASVELCGPEGSVQRVRGSFSRRTTASSLTAHPGGVIVCNVHINWACRRLRALRVVKLHRGIEPVTMLRDGTRKRSEGKGSLFGSARGQLSDSGDSDVVFWPGSSRFSDVFGWTDLCCMPGAPTSRPVRRPPAMVLLMREQGQAVSCRSVRRAFKELIWINLLGGGGVGGIATVSFIFNMALHAGFNLLAAAVTAVCSSSVRPKPLEFSVVQRRSQPSLRQRRIALMLFDSSTDSLPQHSFTGEKPDMWKSITTPPIPINTSFIPLHSPECHILDVVGRRWPVSSIVTGINSSASDVPNALEPLLAALDQKSLPFKR
ncbi:hypothetical protein EYF80_013452 [Liparis tanakae]|uniref:Uncharacterized protein n=1 Tax=Liparis tanakae TaxID=230148 RepID=A0A4Z2IGU1_9TELE|nr:hypothetical protein EYF80_013452 [Liparis tanakae]